MGCLAFLFFGESLAVVSHYCLSLSSPRLCATLRPEICVSQLPCMALAFRSDAEAVGSKLGGGRKPRQSERRAIRARSGDRCSGSRTGDRRLPPNRAVSALPASRRSWGSAAEPAAQLTWGRGRESGAWPRVGGGPRGGVS